MHTYRLWSLGLAVAAVALVITAPVSHALSGIQDLTEWKPTIDNGFGEAKASTDERPNLPVLRYQMAASMSNLLKDVDRDLKALEARKANHEDVDAEIQAMRAIQSDLRDDLTRLSQATIQASNKNQQQDDRLSMLEKVQIHGDVSIGALADFSSNGANGADQVTDAISSVARLRLTVDVPVVEAESDESLLGDGAISSRLIAAIGRYGPSGSNAPGTTGAAANYPFNLYSRVAGDVSAFNEGFGTGAAGGLQGQSGLTSSTRANMYLESVFYKQNFRSAVPFVQLGSREENYETSSDLWAGVIRWWDIFDASPYRGDEQSQFQNNAFINIPGIAVNYAMPMTAYTLHQGLGENLSADFSVGLGTVDVGDALDTMNVTYEGKINYIPTFLPEPFQNPGSIYAGAYHMFLAGNRNFNGVIQNANGYTTRNGTTFNPNFDSQTVNAFYTGWNQEWWRGIGTSVGALFNPNSPTVVLATTQQPGPAGVAVGARSSFNSVLSIPPSAFFGDTFRPEDRLGLGYAFVDIQDGAGLGTLSSEGLEHVFEAYYKYQVNDSFSVIPSVQVIGNALGITQNGVITAVGCRLNYSF